MAKSLKFGYEGEGPMVGRRTAYASYPDVSVEAVVAAADIRRIDSIYFVVDGRHPEFVSSLLSSYLGKVSAITLDFPLEFYQFYTQLSFSTRFIRCDQNTDIENIPTCVMVAHTFIKMVCEEPSLMKAFVSKANQIAELGHTVLLMPDFWTDDGGLLGAEMMKWFNTLHPKVRMMPPIHHVLRMP